MECWGIGPFENEEALRFLGELAAAQVHPDTVVRDILDCSGGVPLELAIRGVCSATLAANTVMRRRRIPMPQEAWRWLNLTGFDCSEVSRNDYRAALLHIARDSELERRWKECPDHADWRRTLVRIEQRFTPMPELKFVVPDHANEREEFWYWKIRQPAIHRRLRAGNFGVDRRAYERQRLELQCGDGAYSEAILHSAAQIGNRQLQLNGLGRLESADPGRGSICFRTHRGMLRDALRLLTACLRQCGLPREAVFFHANPHRDGPFNIARRLYPQRMRREGVAGTCLTKLVASLRFQRPGNIFCYQAMPGFWHYGRVMAIDMDVGVGPDCMLLHYYRESSVAMTKLPEFRLDSLLLPPVVTDRNPWAYGMFQTIDRIKLTESERTALGGGQQKSQRVEALGAAQAVKSAADPALTTSQFSKYLEIDELICQAHDIPLSPLELEE